MGVLKVLILVGVAAILFGGASMVAAHQSGGGGSAGGGDVCSGFVTAYNTAGAHVTAGLTGDFGPPLQSSLRHDGDTARTAAASGSGSTRADLTRFGQTLDDFRIVVHAQPDKLELLTAGTAFADAKLQIAKDCDYTLAGPK